MKTRINELNNNEMVILEEMITKALQKENLFSHEELENALSCRSLYDLEDLIDLEVFNLLIS